MLRVPGMVGIFIQHDPEELVVGARVRKYISAQRSAVGPNSCFLVRSHGLALEVIPGADYTVAVSLDALNRLPNLVALRLGASSNLDLTLHEHEVKPYDIVDRAADHPKLLLTPIIRAAGWNLCLAALWCSRIDHLLHVVIAYELKLLLALKAYPYVAVPSVFLVGVWEKLLELESGEGSTDLEAVIEGLHPEAELRRDHLPIDQKHLLPPSEADLVDCSAWYLFITPIDDPPVVLA
mmetsp:Transcript_61294/g.131797  ORF Transcript_61294/g.131797 Transcript_61294/m.131797 type:complete len:237 (-) Transcript_61294:207-917(-)